MELGLWAWRWEEERPVLSLTLGVEAVYWEKHDQRLKKSEKVWDISHQRVSCPRGPSVGGPRLLGNRLPREPCFRRSVLLGGPDRENRMGASTLALAEKV